MTLTEIAEMCNKVLFQKSNEYASPTDRWHNFHTAKRLRSYFPGALWTLENPEDWVCAFAMKHYASCLDIELGKKNGIVYRSSYIKEKAGDLVNYYLIYRCITEDLVTPNTLDWILELDEKRSEPWIIGLDLLSELPDEN